MYTCTGGDGAIHVYESGLAKQAPAGVKETRATAATREGGFGKRDRFLLDTSVTMIVAPNLYLDGLKVERPENSFERSFH